MINTLHKVSQELKEKSETLNSRYTIIVQGYIEGDQYNISTSKEFTLMSSVLGIPHLKLYEWYVQFIVNNNFIQPNDESCARHICKKLDINYDSTPFEYTDQFLHELPILYDGERYADKITSILLLDHDSGVFEEIKN